MIMENVVRAKTSDRFGCSDGRAPLGVLLRTDATTAPRPQRIIGESPALREVLDHVDLVAGTDATVLITGETGTGKELIAGSIHNLSTRRIQPFVKVNCAAIPSGLLESELFGHEKGAFTGALTRKAGLFELADKGTLFLDEVGDIPLELQPKLLRVLQEQEIQRLGDTRTHRVDVRLVTATNQDLDELVIARQFRSDLFYRLNVFPLRLPPLRERREDIPILVWHYIDKYAGRMNRSIDTIPARAMEALTSHSWPGNVRELQNLVQRAVILSHGGTLAFDEAWLRREAPRSEAQSRSLGRIDMNRERALIETALDDSRGLVAGPRGAAARLGIPRSTLESRIRS